MTLPIALQLYTVRDELLADFEKTLAAVAEIGYRQVEMAGLYNRSAADVRKLCDGLNLTVCSGHWPLERIEQETEAVIDEARTLGAPYVVVPAPPAELRSSAEGFANLARRMTAVGAKLRQAGLSIAYHNHAFEFQTFGGARRGLDIFYDEADADLVKAELDVYWVQHGGDDPVAWIQRLGRQAALLHIKDMAAGEDRRFAEVGTGILDMPTILREGEKAGAQVLIVEQDSAWNGGPLTSARQSFENLTRLVAER